MTPALLLDRDRASTGRAKQGEPPGQGWRKTGPAKLTIQIGVSYPVEIDAVRRKAGRYQLVLLFLVEHQGHESFNLAGGNVITVIALNQAFALCAEICGHERL